MDLRSCPLIGQAGTGEQRRTEMCVAWWEERVKVSWRELSCWRILGCWQEQNSETGCLLQSQTNVELLLTDCACVWVCVRVFSGIFLIFFGGVLISSSLYFWLIVCYFPTTSNYHFTYFQHFLKCFSIIPSITPTLGRPEVLSKLLSNADTPKSFRSRSSRADSVDKTRFKILTEHITWIHWVLLLNPEDLPTTDSTVSLVG